MTQTEQAIENLAEAFCKGPCPKALYKSSLESLVRVAISEHIAAPVIAALADIERVDAIRAGSRG